MIPSTSVTSSPRNANEGDIGVVCRVVHAAAEFRSLRAEWHQLLTNSGLASPCLTWEWTEAWWLQYGSRDPRNRLATVVARSRTDGHLMAILPGYCQRKLVAGCPILAFRLLGTERESSDYLEAIQEIRGHTGLTAALLHTLLAAEPGIDRLELENLADESSWIGDVEAVSANFGYRCFRRVTRVCPYIRVAGRWDDFVAGLTANMRASLRRRTRSFFRHQDHRVTWVRDPAELDDSLVTLFDLHARRFASTGLKTGFRADARLDFHRDVARRFFDADRLRLFHLRAGNRTVAMLYCLVHANELFYFQAGMDPEWESQSVGMVLMGQAIRYAFEEGLTRFDFMRGGEAYKFRWTQDVRHLVSLDIPVTSRGSAVTMAERAGRKVRTGLVRAVRESTAWMRKSPTAR